MLIDKYRGGQPPLYFWTKVFKKKSYKVIYFIDKIERKGD